MWILAGNSKIAQWRNIKIFIHKEKLPQNPAAQSYSVFQAPKAIINRPW